MKIHTNEVASGSLQIFESDEKKEHVGGDGDNGGALRRNTFTEVAPGGVQGFVRPKGSFKIDEEKIR